MKQPRCHERKMLSLHRVSAASRTMLDTLFPPQCMCCGELVKSHGALCTACWQGLHFISSPMCSCCSYPFEYELGEDALCAECIEGLPAYDHAYSALVFDDISKKLLHKLKFEDQGYLARSLAGWLAMHMPHKEADMVIPVPLSRKRLQSRRYNQSALLASYLAQELGVAYQPHLLKRHRHTTPQTGLTRLQRLENVKGAFIVEGKASAQLSGKGILLVDDVMTTGATITACTHALKQAGAERVQVATLARVIGVR